MDNTTKKRPPQNDTVSDNFSHKKPKPQNDTVLNPSPSPPPPPPPFPDLLNDDVFAFADISIDSDELSSLLDTPACPFLYTCPTPCPVKFVAYPYVSPPVEYSTSYVTINGNEETCGSSFSDTDSSVMASFDTATVNIADLWGVACAGACGGGDGGGDWDLNEYFFGEVCGKTT